MPMLTLLALFGTAAGVVLAIERGPHVAIGLPEGEEQLLAGVVGKITIRVSNNHPWRSAIVDSVRTSCGCLAVNSFDTRVRPLRKGSVVLSAQTDARFIGVAQSVEVVLSDGQRLRTLVRTEPVPPFAGWPTHVEVDLAGEEAFFSIHQAYFDVVKEVVALDPADNPLRVEIDRAAGLVVIQCRFEGQPVTPREILFTFGSDDHPNWAGAVRVRGTLPKQNVGLTAVPHDG